LTHWGSSHPHPQSRPTLRTAGTLQGVPPSCCGRRVAVWSGHGSNRPSGFGEAARRASSPRTWRWSVRRSACPSAPTTHPPYVPRPSAVDQVDRDMLNPTSDLLVLPPPYVRCVCTSGSLRTERGGWLLHGAMGRRQCELEGCSKWANQARGSTPYCKAHGGGKRCQHAGCSKSAQGDMGHE
jgi:hypothetical protein